ncbi:protein SGT1 homolog [Prorops nasuta]|uniref:protein SGT1 homolog n=1 Tax=Prorops nasuta TaxID=863751 RepID=UPI0034CEB243
MSQSEPRVRHEWYQTETHVVLTILAKDTNDVVINLKENVLSVSAKLPNGHNYNLQLNLAHSVGEFYYKIMPSKIEVKLTKKDGIQWTALEGNPVTQQVLKNIPQDLSVIDQSPKYPSSSKKSRDWNEVEKEIKKQEADEKLEGDAALNALFQQIYGSGSDEVRRAMNKSFQESGGTVLSTNWSEVGKDKVPVKTPDGVEWKQWSK